MTRTCDCEFDDSLIGTPEYFADPYPVLNSLRETCAVHWSTFLNGWALSRYEDVEWCLGAPMVFSSAFNSARKVDRLPPDLQEHARPLIDLVDGRMVISQDPPRHTHQRKILSRALDTKHVNAMDAAVRQYTLELIDGHRSKRSMDLLHDFARPLPGMVLAKLLGVPVEDRERFIGWGMAVAAFSISSGDNVRDVVDNALRAYREMGDYVEQFVEQRKDAPAGEWNVIQHMLGAETAQGRLSREEIVATCVQFLFAGHETTTGLLATGAYSLFRFPGQREYFASHLDEVGPAIEEMFRYDSPVVAIPARTAMEQVERGGRKIDPGDPVFTIVGAANRDPRVFPDPDIFDILRQPGRHFGLGYGIHFCVGAALARLEAKVAFRALFEALPTLRMADGGPRFRPVFVARLMDSFPVEW
jgi:cytochrome P450